MRQDYLKIGCTLPSIRLSIPTRLNRPDPAAEPEPARAGMYAPHIGCYFGKQALPLFRHKARQPVEVRQAEQVCLLLPEGKRPPQYICRGVNQVGGSRFKRDIAISVGHQSRSDACFQ